MKAPMIKARPTTYKGIKMRSRLEAHFAAMLDGLSEDDAFPQTAEWEYEPDCFAGPAGQWLPDFKITRKFGDITETEYAEVKPWVMVPLPVRPLDSGSREHYEQQVSTDAILMKMETAWLSIKDRAGLTLYFADVKDGRISRYVSIYCLAPGTEWRFGAGLNCPEEIERCQEPYPGLGQEAAMIEAEDIALRAYSVKRMRALGIEVSGS